MAEIKLDVCVYRHCSPSYIHNIFFTNNHLKRRSITTVMFRWTEPFTVSDFVIRFCLFSLPSAPTNWSQREYFFFILTSFLISFFLSVSFIVYKHNEGLLIIKCSTSHICLCESSVSRFWRGIPGISRHTVRDLWWTKWRWSTSVYTKPARSHQCPYGMRKPVPASTSLYPQFSFRASALIGQKSIEHFWNTQLGNNS